MALLKVKLFIGLSVLVSTTFSNAYGKIYHLNHGRGVENSTRLGSFQVGQLNFEYNIGSFEADRSAYKNGLIEQSVELKFKNFQMTDKSGQPRLPYRSFIVSQAKSNLAVELKIGKSKFFKGVFSQVAPTKPCRCAANKKVHYEVKGDYFENSKEQTLYRLESLGTYRGLPLTKVYVYAGIQGRDGLEVFSSLKLSLHAKDRSPVEIANLSFNEANKNFLVVTAHALDAGAQAFATMKRNQGYKVDVYQYEDEARDAESLKAFIKARYNDLHYQYAVLVGSENMIPTFFRETSMEMHTPTDYPYFFMDATDTKIDDYYPEIFYARLTGKTTDDILAQVEKFKEYEARSWEDNSGFDQVMGIASDEGTSPSDVDYVQQMLKPIQAQLHKSATFFLQKNTNSTVQNINDRINHGLNWVNYIGHGSGTAWPSINQDQYYSKDILALEPGHVKPVIIDVACQNGRFNDEERIGETFMTATAMGKSIGALSYFGGSVNITWDPPAIMAVGIGASVSKDPGHVLYSHIMNGQTHLLNTYADLDSAKENLVWYHLLGDPSLKMKTN